MTTPPNIRIVANAAIFDNVAWRQFRFPKSKKRRIRDKWSNKSKNYKWVFVEYRAFQIGDTLHVSYAGYKYIAEKGDFTKVTTNLWHL